MGTYEGSTFQEVRDVIFSDPYDTYPHEKANIRSMFKGLTNLMVRDCQAILADRNDIVPWYQKLVHSTGICLTGTWEITEDSDYTGVFKPGTEALIIVRCSSLLGRSRRTRSIRRGFAFAGKIFPTMDPHEKVKTANVIAIDALGGTRAYRFTDEKLSNEPAVGANLTLLRFPLAAINALYAFTSTTNVPMYRPLTALGEAGLAEGEVAKTPRWLQIEHAPGNGKSDASDLRDELNVKNYDGGVLRFLVSVAEEEKKGERLYRKIGEIALDESVVSDSGDHRIRFWHQMNPGKKKPIASA